MHRCALSWCEFWGTGDPTAPQGFSTMCPGHLTCSVEFSGKRPCKESAWKMQKEMDLCVPGPACLELLSLGTL